MDTRLCDKKINYDQDWTKKHLKSIEHAYFKAPYFGDLYPSLEAQLLKKHSSLTDLTISLIELISKNLGLTTTFSRARDIPGNAGASLNDRILEIARAVGANSIYLGAKAAEYVYPSYYAPHGVQIEFQNFQHPTYPQQFGEFVEYMSIIDLIVNVGWQQARRVLLSQSAHP